MGDVWKLIPFLLYWMVPVPPVTLEIVIEPSLPPLQETFWEVEASIVGPPDDATTPETVDLQFIPSLTIYNNTLSLSIFNTNKYHFKT